MVFSSPIFLLCFLPALLVLYFVFGVRWRNWLLLVFSLGFYAWGEGTGAALMLVAIAMNYAFGILVARFHGSSAGKAILGACIAANLLMLFYFKYLDFAVSNLNALLARLGAAPIPADPVRLPIGISFFTFQAMSYVIDVYRGDATCQRDPSKVALYIALFPQLIAGPIVRYTQVAAELDSRSTSLEGFYAGIQRFVIGLAKKVLVANTVAYPADQIFGAPPSELTAGLAWLGLACYTIQIYYDFSGYSDMAIGLGKMLGFDFMENFQTPYAATSITDFWRRWHISLSTWFRDYLYIPLGGSRGPALKTYRNLLAVFLLCGLWHGANWTFVLWGLLHGTFLIAERLAGPRPGVLPKALGNAYVLGVVMLGWVLFRSETLAGCIAYLKALFGFGEGRGVVYSADLYLGNDTILALVWGFVFAYPVARAAKDRWQGAEDSARPAIFAAAAAGRLAALAALFYLCCAQLSTSTHNPFIYFRF